MKVIHTKDKGVINMDRLEPIEIIKNALENAWHMKKYAYIMDTFRKVDVSKDEAFQTVFDGFYRVRRKKDTWLKIYYEMFEKLKNANPTFEDILMELYDRTGRVEASFASKMLATINPSMPIWDRFVLDNLGFKSPTGKNEKRLTKCVDIYNSIVAWYADFLNTDNAKDCIEQFDKLFPKYKQFTDTKKIDFFIWNMRDSDGANSTL